jgi:site-specific recombinase XerD
MLGRFDDFLAEEGFDDTRITRAITEGYQRTLVELAQRSQYNRFCVVRQFCEYLALDDPISYVPPPMRHVSSRGAHLPYIYSPEQVKSLLEAAETLNSANTLYPLVTKTFLGLLYTTGLRCSEALGLNLEDFYPQKSSLYVREGKFKKDRWIPLATSTCQALKAYARRRNEIPAPTGAPFFVNQRGRRLQRASIYQTFRRLLEKCGIPYQPGAGPRLHDFRHTFANHRLLQWYREGEDPNTHLPALATFMGHVDIQSTQLYLQATPELIKQVDQRFHNHFLNHIQKKKGTSS